MNQTRGRIRYVIDTRGSNPPLCLRKVDILFDNAHGFVAPALFFTGEGKLARIVGEFKVVAKLFHKSRAVNRTPLHNKIPVVFN